MTLPALSRHKPFLRPEADESESIAERQLLLGRHTGSAAGVLELAMARLRELESLLHAYEAGNILVMTGGSLPMRRRPDDPVRELRGRIAAAKDFILHRLPDIATHR